MAKTIMCLHLTPTLRLEQCRPGIDIHSGLITLEAIKRCYDEHRDVWATEFVDGKLLCTGTAGPVKGVKQIYYEEDADAT